MNFFSKLLFLSLSIIIYTQIFAQPVPIKYGKIDMANLKMDTFEADPDASVVILADYATVTFHLSRQISEFKRHKRIKILNKAGLDWADITLKYYSHGTNITGIKGTTYTLEENKIVEHKLSKKSIIDEEVTDSYSQKKISMPKVTEGVIIEYVYTINYKNYHVPDWYFQSSEPTLYSEYRVKIPEYFSFVNYYQGTQKLNINTNEKYTDSESFSGEILKYQGRYYRKVAQNVPALREEPFMTTPNDYLAKSGFQLQSIHIPGDITRNYMESWEKVAAKLWEDGDFGGALKGNHNLAVKKAVSEVIAGKETDQEKMVAIYEYIQKKMEWNGKHRIYTSQNLNKAFEENTGSSSDINLMLTLMLREAEISALPAILSTRSHGKMQPIYPFLDQFNHVIALITLDEKEYWLDAIHKNRPYNLLDDDDLNHKAFVVHPKTPQWKDLKSKQKYYHIANATFELSEDGSLKGTIACSDKDYSAFYNRSNLKTDGKEKFAQRMFEKDLTDIELHSYTFENQDELAKPLKSNYEMTINSAATIADNRIYLNPMLNQGMTQNPFKLEERTYPVDFGHGYSSTYIFNLAIPEGYEIEELPDGIRIGLTEKGGSFAYNISANGNNIQLMSKLSINKVLFEPEEYKGIKEFYDLIVTKHAEQIVLKKSE